VVTRHLAIRLLAPTVLVSLALVVACTVAAVYLTYLNISVSEVLRENVQSTQVAARLETTARELIRLFRTGGDDGQLMDKVQEQNQRLDELEVDAADLANLERERVLVNEIRDNLHEYRRRWTARNLGAPSDNNRNAELAHFLEEKVLAPSINLRRFNTDQVEEAERRNHDMVGDVRWWLVALGVFGPLGGLLLGYKVARGLRHSMYELSVSIRDAAGKLKRELGSVRLDEESHLGELQEQMKGVVAEIARMVEELQQRERELLRSEQLAAVGRVAAGVAHELRNPLTAIKMLAQTGLEDTPGGIAGEDLRIIESEVRRMESTIKSLLDFAKPPCTERRPTDLNVLVRRAVDLMEGRARRQHVVIEPIIPADLVIVNIDAGQIHQVLLNLLFNAVDALPHGGHVRVVLEAGSGIEVRVEDDGPGIAPQIRERLFEPFVSSKDTGLGLGLSICKRLVEGHGGTIRGTNAEHGAVFAFTLFE
jgi:two-component system sensor histidine kinase HydH